MFTTLKQYLNLLLAVVVMGALAFGFVAHQREQAATKRAEVATANAKAYEEYASQTKTVAKKETIRNDQVQAAVEANPVWAELPLPDDVADLLRHPSGSTRAVP